MKLPPLSRQQVRRVDQIAIEEYGINGLVLMENAGLGAAEIIHRIDPAGLVVILCGRGNNAGDGYVIARHLDLWEQPVRLVSIVELDALSGDAAANASIAERAGLDICVATNAEQLRPALSGGGTIVDCLLGTGAQGELREPFRGAVALANETAAIRIAIDIPTGLDCDSGQAGSPTFRADHTITFVAEKTGLRQRDASAFVGEIHVVGIGAPRSLLARFRNDDS